MEHVLPISTTIIFHFFSLFLPFPFKQFCMVHHHPNEPIQNHTKPNIENASYGA
jgi:hypothetical protein